MNNISKIDGFFKNIQKQSLILNHISEELDLFYIFVLKYFSKLVQCKLEESKNESIDTNVNLFEEQKIYFYRLNNSKIIDTLLTKNTNFILITDYKNYKKLNSKFLSLNGYDFKKDIKFFIHNVLGIKDTALIDYCIENPVMIYSETHKYFISGNYQGDFNKKEKDFIPNIRKNIFQIKRGDNDPKKIYDALKDEIKYKRLSFLTY